MCDLSGRVHSDVWQTDQLQPTRWCNAPVKPFQLVGYAHIVLSKRDIFWNGSSSRPAHSAGRFEFALQKGLEKSNTFLASCDTFLREPTPKLASPLGVLLAGLTQWWQGSDFKQPIAYRVIWTRPIDHAFCSEENDSFPRPTCNLRPSLVWQ